MRSRSRWYGASRVGQRVEVVEQRRRAGVEADPDEAAPPVDLHGLEAGASAGSGRTRRLDDLDQPCRRGRSARRGSDTGCRRRGSCPSRRQAGSRGAGRCCGRPGWCPGPNGRRGSTGRRSGTRRTHRPLRSPLPGRPPARHGTTGARTPARRIGTGVAGARGRCRPRRSRRSRGPCRRSPSDCSAGPGRSRQFPHGAMLGRMGPRDVTSPRVGCRSDASCPSR